MRAIPAIRARRATLFGCGVVLVVAIAACSSFSSEDPALPAEGGVADADTDALVADAAMADGPVIPAEAGVDASNGGLLINGSFEDPTGQGCGLHWTVDQGNGERSDAGRTGSRACVLCVTNGTAAIASVGNSTTAPFTGKYTASAYVRLLEGDAGPPPDLAHVDVFSVPFGRSNTDRPTPTWGIRQVSVSVVEAGAPITVELLINGSLGTCAEFDDASLLFDGP